MKCFQTITFQTLFPSLQGTDECHEHAECDNFIGGYNCSCAEGFDGNGFNCTDIDECDNIDLRLSLGCDLNADCVNFIGEPQLLLLQ